jgi:hypothetical protein
MVIFQEKINPNFNNIIFNVKIDIFWQKQV